MFVLSAPNQLMLESWTGLFCESRDLIARVCRNPAAMPPVPGSVTDASAMLIPGVLGGFPASSLVIVPVAVAFEMVCACRIRQCDGEGFVRFGRGVAEDADVDGLRCHAGAKVSVPEVLV